MDILITEDQEKAAGAPQRGFHRAGCEIGGLLTSTLLTLFAIPTLHTWVTGWRERRGVPVPEAAEAPDI